MLPTKLTVVLPFDFMNGSLCTGTSVLRSPDISSCIKLFFLFSSSSSSSEPTRPRFADLLLLLCVQDYFSDKYGCSFLV